LQTLMTDAAVSARLALAGVVTTVDAATGAATLAREPISVKQVAVADRLVLTKSDLTGAPPPQLMQRLAALNGTAALLAAEHGRIDPQRLFDCGPYDPATRSLDLQSWLGEPAEAHAHERHDAEIACYAIVREAPIRAVTLTLLLETLAEHCGADLLR